MAIVQLCGFGSIERLVFRRRDNETRVALGLHPRMPEKTVVVRAIAAPGIANVCYGNQAMRRKFPDEANDMATGTMKLIGEDLERRPSAAFPAREIH